MWVGTIEAGLLALVVFAAATASVSLVLLAGLALGLFNLPGVLLIHGPTGFGFHLNPPAHVHLPLPTVLAPVLMIAVGATFWILVLWGIQTLLETRPREPRPIARRARLMP